MHATGPTLTAGILAMVVGVMGWMWPASDAETAWAAAVAPEAEVDLQPWLPARRELLDPTTRLPHTHRLPIEGLRAVMAGVSDGGDHAGLRKLATWETREGTLPDAFFEQPPRMHPSGRSYAALAGRATGRHVEEAPPEGPLGATTSRTRQLLLRGHTRIVGEQQVLMGVRPGVLGAVSRTTFNARLAARGQRYVACVAVSARCLEPTPRPWAMGLVAAGGLLVGIGALMGGVAMQRTRRRGAEARAFVLRTLTHELRTPASAIGLELDRLRHHFDALPEDGQDALLGLMSANQRLRGTLAATARFLSVDRGTAGVEPSPVQVSTLLPDVETDGDATLHTDPRWLAVALDNLVANARTHGAEPVVVRVTRESEGVRITVQDAGDLDTSLDALSQPFQRGVESTGLGLGLALTTRIATMLGGRLTLQTEPTRFTLHLGSLP